ncbi:MAG TPA: dihydrodipicolinate synthase family protein [Acetobacteraceae bacterium]|nr:dihydrodipicolinate synthase family protein [Acetobacteraceae bacterium]
MSDRIEGLWAALATPVRADGAVDEALLVRHSRWLLEQGCDGLVPFGTTGEGTSFAAAERLGAVEALLAAGIGSERIALGVGCPAVPDTVALCRGALGLGLQHVLTLPPYFFRDAPEEGIEDAFASVLDGVGDARLRMTLYNIPQVAGIGVPPAVVARLRARYGLQIAGVKDSSADFDQLLAFRAAAPDVAVTTGSEPDIARAMAAGGTGTICGMVNVTPLLVRAMFVDKDAAGPMRRACALINGPFVALLKSILAAQTGEPGWSHVRPPLRPVDPAIGRGLARELRALEAAETVG